MLRFVSLGACGCAKYVKYQKIPPAFYPGPGHYQNKPFQKIKACRFYGTSHGQDPSMKKFRNYKRIFSISLFTGTFVLAWYLKKLKGEKLRTLLEDFTRLPVDDSLFGAEVSLYRHKGYIFPGQMVMSGVFKELPHFQFRASDVIVASYPKCGTTWMQEIVYMLTHNLEKTGAANEVLETRFPYLEYPYPGIKSVAAKPGPRLIKTHLPLTLLPPSFENSNAKLIYITRNPRDTAVSYFHFMRLLTACSYQGSLSTFFKMFLSDTVMYSPFFDHVLGYWNCRKQSNILFVKYEDLLKEPVNVIKKIAEFLEVEVCDTDVVHIAHSTSFKSMSANASVNYEHWKDLGFAHKDKGKFLRKGKVGDWQNHMTEGEVAAFEEWEKRHLADSGLTFTFTLPEAETDVA
ncbi:sulfotransferase 1C4-like [Penaeus japonicus]|uniref:sulfotransferase 1C4-like n=1 Tax=Penaeus japonicus TaxID=27405 RepID=UPI001C71445B|nr:sulfotransferase 1C4-like [Penaeus japonicus]